MWWQQERNIFRGVPLQGYPHNKVLWTDASKWGWGAHLGTHQVAGQWTKELINHHINWLEMRAVWNALIEFQEEIQGENLLIRCDNATVVAYINKQGGTKSISFMGHDAVVFKTQHSHPFSCLTFIKTLGMSMGGGNAYANIPSQLTDSASHVHARGSG
jgi:hypothetical protein